MIREEGDAGEGGGREREMDGDDVEWGETARASEEWSGSGVSGCRWVWVCVCVDGMPMDAGVESQRQDRHKTDTSQTAEGHERERESVDVRLLGDSIVQPQAPNIMLPRCKSSTPAPSAKLPFATLTRQ